MHNSQQTRMKYVLSIRIWHLSVNGLFSNGALGPTSNNPGFSQKHPGIVVGSESGDGTSSTLMEKHTLPITQEMGHFGGILPVLCGRDVVAYIHHQDNTCVILSPGAGVMQ